MNQGWCETVNEVTHFYPCRLNIPRIVNQLSNCADALEGTAKKQGLNPLAAPCLHGVCKEEHVSEAGRKGVDVNGKE